KIGNRTVFRVNRSGLGEEEVYAFEAPAFAPIRILPFPDGNHLLVLTGAPGSQLEQFHPYEVDLSRRTAVDLGEVPGNAFEVVWAEPGKNVLFSRTVNGLTN